MVSRMQCPSRPRPRNPGRNAARGRAGKAGGADPSQGFRATACLPAQCPVALGSAITKKQNASLQVARGIEEPSTRFAQSSGPRGLVRSTKVSLLMHSVLGWHGGRTSTATS